MPPLISRQVEALIFASAEPITAEEILQVIQQVQKTGSVHLEHVQRTIEELVNKYEREEYAFSLMKSGGGYRFFTKAQFHPLLDQLQLQQSTKKLSQAALETLSIIAYRQPVTRVEIEEIRGVNSDYSVQRLLEKDLIRVLGKSDALGRPVLYGVSELFLDYFGLNSIKELPKLGDVIPGGNAVGQSED